MLNQSTKVVIEIQPGLKKQNVYVFENDEVKIKQCDLNNICDTILAFSPNTVFLSGAKNITNKIKEDLEYKEKTQFNTNNIDINLM